MVQIKMVIGKLLSSSILIFTKVYNNSLDVIIAKMFKPIERNCISGPRS